MDWTFVDLKHRHAAMQFSVTAFSVVDVFVAMKFDLGL